MYVRRGNNWSLTIYTDTHMLMALYLRELGGVNPAEVGPNCKLGLGVKERAHPNAAHGQLKQEWSSWWDSLTTQNQQPEGADSTNLLDRLETEGYPELARLARSHYGQTTLFAHQEAERFERDSRSYIPERMNELERILIDHGVEHAKDHEETQIQLIDVPMNEPRAWLTGGATILASTTLLQDSTAFRGFIQPMVTIIFPG